MGFVGAAYSTSGCYAVEGHGSVNFDLWLPQVLSSRVYVYSKFIDALCRSLGGTVGISIGQAIYSSVGHLNLGMNQNSMLYFLQVLNKKVRNFTNLSLDTSPGGLSESVRKLKTISVSES